MRMKQYGNVPRKVILTGRQRSPQFLWLWLRPRSGPFQSGCSANKLEEASRLAAQAAAGAGSIAHAITGRAWAERFKRAIDIAHDFLISIRRNAAGLYAALLTLGAPERDAAARTNAVSRPRHLEVTGERVFFFPRLTKEGLFAPWPLPGLEAPLHSFARPGAHAAQPKPATSCM